MTGWGCFKETQVIKLCRQITEHTAGKVYKKEGDDEVGVVPANDQAVAGVD